MDRRMWTQPVPPGGLRQEYVFRCYKQVQVEAGRLSRVVRPRTPTAGRQAEGVTVRNATCSVILLVSLTAHGVCRRDQEANGPAVR